MSSLMQKRLLLLKPGRQRVPLITTLRNLGLTSGLQFCLDAGVASSYASGQSWLDLSGNGQDFFLGATSGATASDPTFNGTAGGVSSSEYFSVDGGDYFTYDTTNPAWVETLHKDNATFSFACWVFPQGAVGNGLFGTTGNSVSNIGAHFFYNPSNGNVTFVVANGSGSADLTASAPLGSGIATWGFIAISFSEGGTAILVHNEASALVSAAMTSPSSSSATHTLGIGQVGNGTLPMSANGRLAQAMMWDVALSRAQLRAIFNATRKRYGV